jgi:putative tricarboxylic transport membrane protein
MPIMKANRLAMRQNFAGGLAIMAIAVIAYWLARDLPAAPAGMVGPGTLPRALAALLGLLGFALLLGAVFKTGVGLARWSIRGPMLILGALVLFGLTVRPLGLVVAGPLAIVVAAFASSDVRWGETLIFGGLMTAFCIGLFKFALGLPIPLAPWLVGY